MKNRGGYCDKITIIWYATVYSVAIAELCLYEYASETNKKIIYKGNSAFKIRKII